MCTNALTAAVTTDIEIDHQVCIHSLASAHGTSIGTFFSIVECPNVAIEEDGEERRGFFQKDDRTREEELLVFTIYASAMPIHTPETKAQSMQWLGKCKSGSQGKGPSELAEADGPRLLNNNGMVYTN